MNRALVLAALASLATITACGGKIDDNSDLTAGGSIPTTTGTTTPGSPGSSGSSGGAGSTSSGGTTPGVPPPPPPKDPPAPSTKVITAAAMAGGLDHILIFAADPTADSCVTVHLVHPFSGGANDPFASVFTAKGWGVKGISRAPGAKTCAPGKQPPPAETADGAKGTITFGATSTVSLYPCTVDVHLAAIFAGKPTLEQLDGDKITVEGACK